jgi:enoyl-CoA hydratase/carnithine racemase
MRSLEVAFHTNGGKLVFNGHTHEQFTDMFHQIGEDYHNRAVILTGSGDVFMNAIDPEGFDFFTPRGYDKIFTRSRRASGNLL